MRARVPGIPAVLATILIAGCGAPAASSRSSSGTVSRAQWPSTALNAITAADCIAAVRTLNSLSAAYRSASGPSQLAAVASMGSNASSTLGYMLNTSPGLDELISVDIQQAASDADVLGTWINDDLAGLPGSALQVNQEARALGHDTMQIYSVCGR